jgi:hypothetical protein
MHIREPHTTKLKMMTKRRLKECSKRLHVGGCYQKRGERHKWRTIPPNIQGSCKIVGDFKHVCSSSNESQQQFSKKRFVWFFSGFTP